MTIWPEEGDVVYVVCEHHTDIDGPLRHKLDYMVDHGQVQNVIPQYSNPKRKYEVEIDGHYGGLHREKPGHDRMFYSPWDAIGQAWKNAQKETNWWVTKHHYEELKSDVLIPPGTMDRLNRWRPLHLQRRTGYLPLNFKVMARESEERIKKEMERLNGRENESGKGSQCAEQDYAGQAEPV